MTEKLSTSTRKRTLKKPWQVAVLLVELMRRSKKDKARISDKTLRVISGRVQLENSFREAVRVHALEYGFLLHKFELKGASGTVIIDLSSASTAKILLFANFFTEDERQQIKDGRFDFDGLYESLFMEPDDNEDDLVD